MFLSVLCACHCEQDMPLKERPDKLVLCNLKVQEKKIGEPKCMTMMFKYVKSCC